MRMWPLKLYILSFTVSWKPFMIRNEMMEAARPIEILTMAILWMVEENPSLYPWLILLDMK